MQFIRDGEIRYSFNFAIQNQYSSDDNFSGMKYSSTPLYLSIHSYCKKINILIQFAFVFCAPKQKQNADMLFAIVWSIQKTGTNREKNYAKKWNKQIFEGDEYNKRCFMERTTKIKKSLIDIATRKKRFPNAPFFNSICTMQFTSHSIVVGYLPLWWTLYLLFDCRIQQNEGWYAKGHECKSIDSRLPKCKRSTNGCSHTQKCTK